MRSRGWKRWAALLAGAVALLLAAPAAADRFEQLVAQIDQALATNPAGVPEHNLKACKSMRDMAVKLYRMGKPERAERRLKMCRKLLEID